MLEFELDQHSVEFMCCVSMRPNPYVLKYISIRIKLHKVNCHFLKMCCLVCPYAIHFISYTSKFNCDLYVTLVNTCRG